MSSHFRWYPSSEESIVPYNARFTFPGQANKAEKSTPRIPPKNGAVFAPGSTIRLEFPAQGYVNPLHTFLEFDVTLYAAGTPAGTAVRIQNNVQSIFSRGRVLYGSTPLEDLINMNTIVRLLTEWTSTNVQGILDQTSIAEGIGGYVMDCDGGATPAWGFVNARQKYIQSTAATIAAAVPPVNFVEGVEVGPAGDTTEGAIPGGAPSAAGRAVSTQRYQVNLPFGLMTQDRLIPTKFMASALAIELTLEEAARCLYVTGGGTTVGGSAAYSGTPPSYAVGNVCLIPEVLQFDASYDATFLKGLREKGVPLKICTWHTNIGSSGKGSNINFAVQERAKSVKSVFAVQKRQTADFKYDNGATFFDTSSQGTTLQNFQFRIGNRYFPASPVQTSSIGGSISNGGAEAYLELQKALNTVGDYRLQTNTNAKNWAVQLLSCTGNDPANLLPEYDYSLQPIKRLATGRYEVKAIEHTGNGLCGTLPPSCFSMATSLETSNGMEISGLNAEETSDISLMAYWKNAQVTGPADIPTNIEVYSYIDTMIVLRENNVVELIY